MQNIKSIIESKNIVSNLMLHEVDGFVAINKLCGLNTHSADFEKHGVAEYLQEELNQKIYPIHRLDQQTSGLLLLTTNKEKAQEMKITFENHHISKKYYFLTDRKVSQSSYKVQSHIEKMGNQFISHQKSPANSETKFNLIQSMGHIHLWLAEPLTGKPHQIRLHAESLGMPLLGDQEHQGSAFFRLCLHSHALSFQLNGKDYHFEAPLTPLFNPYFLENNLNSPLWYLAFEEFYAQKQMFFNFKSKDCFRILHNEFPGLRVDQYGAVIWFYWYFETEPNELDLKLFQKISDHYQKAVVVRKMQNRGEDPLAKSEWQWIPTTLKISPELNIQNGQLISWQATENLLNYELRTNSGLSPGLFLDQRHQRQWVLKHAQDKKILNLFSYTSGFSLAASFGNALEVTTVDVSKNFIEWSKRNFEINKITLPNRQLLFFVQDVILFLKGSLKRNKKFNLIICDPPSFGRHQDGVFKLDKDIFELLNLCFDLLESQGALLFSCNYEKWNLKNLEEIILTVATQKRKKIKMSHAPIGMQFTQLRGVDFEKPQEETLMKSLLIEMN